MNEKQLFDAITNVPDDLVEEAAKAKPKRRISTWKKWTALAACAAVSAGAVWTLTPRSSVPSKDPSPPDTATTTTPTLITTPADSAKPLVEVTYPPAYTFLEGRPDSIWANTPVNKSFLDAVSTFSYKTASAVLTSHDGNVNYSPLSLYYALSLAASGAGGDTASQLYTLLGVDGKASLEQQCSHLYQRLYFDNDIGRLKIANSLWLSRDCTFKSGYAQSAADHFFASAYPADFGTDKTDRAMSQWVAENTDATLAPAFQTDKAQLLSILNTVYFYDEWANAFSEASTGNDNFHLANGKTVSFPFMNSKRSTAYVKGNGYTRSRLELKNAGGMVFILPDEGTDPRELLATPEKARAVFEEGEETNLPVTWKLPKFKFQSQFNLIDTVKALGVSEAFGPNANFSGITDEPAGISGIQQGTYIGINENGVEAAAYTEISLALSSRPSGHGEMILDRPFIYGITGADGTLLFMGICDNPSA